MFSSEYSDRCFRKAKRYLMETVRRKEKKCGIFRQVPQEGEKIYDGENLEKREMNAKNSDRCFRKAERYLMETVWRKEK